MNIENTIRENEQNPYRTPIILYTIGCPMCKRLEAKLKQKNIAYQTVTDEEEILKNGIRDLPALRVNGTVYLLKEAMKLIEEM